MAKTHHQQVAYMTEQREEQKRLGDDVDPRPTPMDCYHRWPLTIRTPCLVFDRMGLTEQKMLRYYLKRGDPFRVVMT